MRKVSIGRAVKELGVSRGTLRRWEQAGEIEVERASNGRRRYDLDSLRTATSRVGGSESGATLAYARVEEPSQARELTAQVTLLESFCIMNGWIYRILQDVGSSLSDDGQGLQVLMDRLGSGDITRLVITRSDRVPRYCKELLLSLCEESATEVVVINPTKDSKTRAGAVVDALGATRNRVSKMNGNSLELRRGIPNG